MADWFVRNLASGTGDGTTEANAYTTLQAAFTAKGAGHRFFVASDHIESGVSLVLTSGGTVLSPCSILCYLQGTTPSDATLINAAGGASGARFFSTATTNLSTAGINHWQGCRFEGGESGALSGGTITLSATNGTTTFENCHFRTLATAGTGTVRGGGSLTKTILRNCTVQFGSSTHGIHSNGGVLEWYDTDNAVSGVVPSNGLVNNNNLGRFVLSGIDLSHVNTTNGRFVGPTSGGEIMMINCELHAAPTLPFVTPNAPGSVIVVVNSVASGGGNYLHEKYTYQGTQKVETTVIRTGGASDGTQGISWKITPTANNEYTMPFECLPIVGWNDVEDVSRTVTIEGTWAGGAVPTQDDIWMTVEYLGDVSAPRGQQATTKKATVMTTASSYSSSAAVWPTGTEFKMSVTFTPTQKGPYRVIVEIAHANASNIFYICPKPTIVNT